MARYLIIANQTLGGARLTKEIEDRIGSRIPEFYVVVPQTEPAAESPWTPSDPLFDIPRADEDDEQAKARRHAADRLHAVVQQIRDAGGEADGEVGSPDPYEAAKDVLATRDFDEVIVSTLPAGVSRWLKMDLPSRLQRLTEVPVITVEAEA